ncbi:MAG: thioredoxin family protein [Lentimicrobiaceae bacterium]|jgi:thiol:disulfide interchange protein DsbD|nr:thioredoxin family protein [Lentimicrobiaceae bacterium]
MKKFILRAFTFIVFLLPTLLFAQVLEPVRWNFSTESLDKNEFNLIFTADIDPTWHLYSQDIPMSPPATTFTFNQTSAFELIGEVVEGKSTEQYDKNFGTTLKFFSNKAVFKQKVRLTSNKPVKIDGVLEFMCCDDKSCLPPTEIDFDFQLTPSTSETPVEQSTTAILEPVIWSYSFRKVANNQYDLIFEAQIDKGYHLYSIHVPDGGPLPTEFIFQEPKGFTYNGGIQELSVGKTKYDDTFEMEVKSFEDKALFAQRIGITGKTPVSITGEIAYMVCNDVGCVALYHDMALKFDGKNITAFVENQTTDQVVIQEYKNEVQSGSSLWAIILEAIIWGFVALLTPCVFPMVPMTVSFFLKGSENKAKGRIMASFYGFSIIALYTLPIAMIIMVTYLIGGDAITGDIFNWLATHWLPNILFFIIFMIFAASFFGAFEITLPNWMVSKSDAKSDKGGLTGVFFMALTLVLVSFSCTGPIVGSVLINSTQGEIWEPIVTMLAFSTAFAIPFTIFAFVPSLLNDLPKSGGWLNSVKVVLGFIELALGLKFLSVADQTYHWGILDREVYLALWIVIFALMGLYLIGKLKFAHDSDMPYLSVPRLMLAIITFTFVIYLIPGMFGAPLKAFSGYMPPMHTLDFDLNRMMRDNATSSNTLVLEQKNDLCETPKYGDKLHLPHGLQGYFDYEQALACAKAVGKPLFIDFTGHGCVNCREMEANVWSNPRVLELLRNEFVIVALYVDDRTKLDESEWITSSYDGKVKKTIGRKYADFQISKFGVNAQPFYVLMGHDGDVLTQPRSYDLNADAFVTFLEQGLQNYKDGKSVSRISK